MYNFLLSKDPIKFSHIEQAGLVKLQIQACCAFSCAPVDNHVAIEPADKDDKKMTTLEIIIVNNAGQTS